MKPSIKFSGIYDLRTMKFLKGKGLQSFAFDFDPKSFNFLQGHLFQDILRENFSPLDHYSLSFGKTSILNAENTLNDFLVATNQDRSFVSNLVLELPESELEVVKALRLP